jgi:hypothetical protein
MYENTSKSRPIEFLGYAFERVDSEVTREKVLRYDTSKPMVWTVPLFDELEPRLTVTPPQAYVVPPAHAKWISEKLKLHGIQFKVLKEGKKAQRVLAFKTKDFHFGKEPFEGRTELKLEGAWEKTQRDIPVGSLWVPVNQPYKLVVLHLFEPAAPDSFLNWGFFNADFERKEYMESYVLEPWATEQLQKDPALKEAFEQKLKSSEFKDSDEARLNFFYDRHPARDTHYANYPILAVP